MQKSKAQTRIGGVTSRVDTSTQQAMEQFRSSREDFLEEMKWIDELMCFGILRRDLFSCGRVWSQISDK